MAVKKPRTEITTASERDWYYFLNCIFDRNNYQIYNPLAIKDVILDINKIEFLWEELEGRKLNINKNLWWTGHFDVVVAENNKPIMIYEINGSYHDPKNDFAKLCFCLAAGIEIHFIDKFYDSIFPPHSVNFGNWQNEYEGMYPNIIDLVKNHQMIVFTDSFTFIENIDNDLSEFIFKHQMETSLFWFLKKYDLKEIFKEAFSFKNRKRFMVEYNGYSLMEDLREINNLPKVNICSFFPDKFTKQFNKQSKKIGLNTNGAINILLTGEDWNENGKRIKSLNTEEDINEYLWSSD